MLLEKTFNEKVFSCLIAHACDVLKLSTQQIKEKFSSYPICDIDYNEKNNSQKVMEIRFNDEQTTMTCLFDKNQQCSSAFIFPDYLSDLREYVNYFNTFYKYDYIKCRWILVEGCFLSLKESKDVVCFVVRG